MMVGFAILLILGWGISFVHALNHKRDYWVQLYMPTYAFKYARDNGLWYSVLLQVIGLFGVVSGWIIDGI
ncbi:hypothetical protein [Suttonella ornithocola]|uniref:Uncharacterized protein n=1 Tax=Suttonella ornithocola TaxID=279832 RepID=A0A380MZM4_9GAMM|nr:hypothetical protein [Suttonella ornithocola]SUO97674.1 Uncharacterised protein [Suttonella ornithocola]